LIVRRAAPGSGSQLPDAGARASAGWPVQSAWPQRLLSHATHRDPRPRAPRAAGRVRAVVGSDGRIYKPVVKASVDRAHDAAIQNALPFWRFEPARRADAPVGARVSLEIVLRVY
jgi:outer membrane biosynthesis protein TonB